MSVSAAGDVHIFRQLSVLMESSHHMPIWWSGSYMPILLEVVNGKVELLLFRPKGEDYLYGKATDKLNILLIQAYFPSDKMFKVQLHQGFNRSHNGM